MIHSRLAVALCFAACVTATIPGRAADLDLTADTFSKLSAEEKALLREYAEQYDRLKEFYDNITIEAQEKHFGYPRAGGGAFPPAPDAELTLMWTKDFVYRARQGTHYRLDVDKWIGIVTPSESHLFGLDDQTGGPYLIGHGKDRDKYMTEIHSYAFPIAPIGIRSMLLSWKVFPHVRGKMVEHVKLSRDESDEEIVTIAILYGGAGGQLETYQLYRKRFWAVKEISERFGEHGQYRRYYRCAYKGEVNGFPLLSEYTFEAKLKEPETEKEELQQSTVYAIKAIVPGAPDAAHFDATPLLKESGQGGVDAETIADRSSSRAKVNVLLAISGAVLVLLAIFLSRKRPAPGSP